MKRSLIAITILVAAAAHATTMIQLDLKTMTERADRVVLGTVESTVSRWTADHSAIYTDATVRVAKSYKGALKPGDALVVRREGGSVDGIGMRVFGAANFERGEEVVVFAETRGAATWVVGMAQGKLRVTADAGGRKYVSANLSGLQFTTTPQPQPARTLDDLEREIRTYARSAR
ncbi:MAG TPA: hypothetical protein VFF06_06035 [Polyangia bacterium]|nr:hypothetical protein [Polyangia bacterium]